MEKIKIGLFIDTWYPMIDGVINVVNNYAEILSEIAEVTVFTCGTQKKDTRDYPYKVVRSGSIALPFFDYEIPTINPKFQRAIKSANLDIIHIHSPFMIGKTGVEFAKKHKLPAVGTMHSLYYKDFYRYTKNHWMSKQLLKGIVKIYNECDYVNCPNEATTLVASEYGIKPQPYSQKNATSMLPLEDKAPAFEYFEKKYHINKDENVFLYVGRINLLKNLKFTIEALKILKDKGITFKMLFVGTGSDAEELQKLVKKLGLCNDVIFTGRVSSEEIVFAYARAKLFLFPSEYDTDGIVKIEASSQKTPSVVLRGSVNASSHIEDVNCFMSGNDVSDYADTIEKILNDEKLYSQVSENAFRDLYVTWRDTVMNMYEKYLIYIDDNRKKVEQEKQAKLAKKTKVKKAKTKKVAQKKVKKPKEKIKKEK